MGLFDGVSTLIAGVFGDTLTIVPAQGVSFDVQGIFRADPVEVLDQDGRGVLIVSPTLKTTASQAALISVNDQLTVGGTTYRVQNAQPMGSPGVDAMVIHELEDLSDG